MDKLIKQIQEVAQSANRDDRTNQSLSGWIRYCRERGISLMGLETLLNFYFSDEFHDASSIRKDACFVNEAQMEINVIELQKQIEELKMENRQLRDEIARCRQKSPKKKWFG